MPRRRLFRMLVWTLGSFLLPSCRSEAEHTAVQFRGGPERQGIYDVRPVRAYGGLQWRFATQGAVRSTPVVIDSIVYVGSGDGRLYAIMLHTGDELWNFDAGTPISSSPAVSHGTVYFTGRNGSLYAVDAQTGAARWVTATGPETAWAWGHESGDRLMDNGSAAGNLRSYLEAAGKLVWVGMPPLMRRRNSVTGAMPPLLDTGWDLTTRFLDVDHSSAIFDQYTFRLTSEALRWGLNGWATANWSARPDTTVSALGFDEQGLAPLWLKSYGGPPGTGFLRLPSSAGWPTPRMIQAAAEYRPIVRATHSH